MTGHRWHFFLILLFSGLVRWVLWPMARLVSIFSDRVRIQTLGRPKLRETVLELASRRRKFDDCIVFFCSSAGEFEQAKPLIRRLSTSPNLLCHVFFFSASGAHFVKARNDDVSWTLAPADEIWAWGSIFAALRPSHTVIIRHEVWPSFLWTAKQWSQVLVVDAVVPSLWGRQAKWKENLSIAVKGWLLRSVDRVFVVSRHDQEFFERWLQIPASRISITGDTKYDRVLERAAEKREAVLLLRRQYQNVWHPDGCDVTLIGGSVHMPDVEILSSVIQNKELSRIKLMLVPHDVSATNIAKIYEFIRNSKLSCELLSEIESAGFNFSGEHPRIILVDEMGRLSDLYGVANLAWIGGAVHAKVHNVLEPAAWGLPVSCGVNFKNSQEAQALHDAGLLFASNDVGAVCRHLREALENLDLIGQKTFAFAKSMAGASDAILAAGFKAEREMVVNRD